MRTPKKNDAPGRRAPGRLQSLAYCDIVLCSGSAMPSAIEMSHLFMQANAALVETLVMALQGIRHAPTPTVSLPRFFGRLESPGELTIDEWLSEFDVFVRQCGVPEGERALVLVDYLGGCAKEEVLCRPDEVRREFGALVSLLRRMFGPCETVTSLYA